MGWREDLSGTDTTKPLTLMPHLALQEPEQKCKRTEADSKGRDLAREERKESVNP